MKTMLGRRRCKICTKWLPKDHDSYFCSGDCEKTFNQESAYWERYKEKNRQDRIQDGKDYRHEQNKCLNCGTFILQKDNGRFRRYCGDGCKQEVYRKRKKVAKS